MRVSVSNLDLFRRYRRDEDFPLNVLLRQLRREEPPTLAMQAGTALHAVLEHADSCDLSRVEQDGFTFTFDLNAALVLAPFREISGTRDYSAGGEIVTLSARVDSFYGVTVEDHKLTSHFDAERYAESYQWRAYLSIFGADRCTYNVFVGKVDEETKAVSVDDFHRITFYRYPELETDLARELAFYVDFASQHMSVAA